MIPPFNHNHVLPPFIADPTIPGFQSPYKCSIMEFCQFFATSDQRIELLKGFVRFRLKCVDIGIIDGFQWIDGSFIEDIMARDHREPNDIDVVSFVFNLNPSIISNITTNFPEFINQAISKVNYHVDHYCVEADNNPKVTIEGVKYWNQLFGHNRLGVWKGMIEIELNKTKFEDSQALAYLNTL